jgi:hypothetical protein
MGDTLYQKVQQKSVELMIKHSELQKDLDEFHIMIQELVDLVQAEGWTSKEVQALKNEVIPTSLNE